MWHYWCLCFIIRVVRCYEYSIPRHLHVCLCLIRMIGVIVYRVASPSTTFLLICCVISHLYNRN